MYVEDVARANVLALEGEVPPSAYNVGTGSETSVNELYRLLLKVSGKDLAPEHGPAKAGEQLRSSVDPTLAGRVMADGDSADGSNRFLESDETNNSTWADLQITGNTVTVLGYGPTAPPVG